MEVHHNETVVSKMDTAAVDLGPLDGVDCSYGTYGMLVVVVLFQFINWILKFVGPPKSLRDDEWKWRNLAISWLHALVCIFWLSYSYIMQFEMLQDLQHYKTYSILLLVMFSTGYFLYDFLDLALNGKMLALWEVQLHHIAVGGMFYFNLVYCEWLSFNIIALTVEVNSFFLHSRKLLQMVGTSYDKFLYRVVCFLNITTFVVFRGVPFAAILWAMSQWYHRVSFTYYLCLGMSMFVMITMNPILFMRLLHSDYLRSRGKKSMVAMNGNNNHSDNDSHFKVS